MAYTCVQVSLSSIFIPTYNLNFLEAGLIYIPFGIGAVLATVISGRVLDRDYRIIAKRYGITVDEVRGDDMTEFPIEKARYRSIVVPSIGIVGCIIGVGWALQAGVVSV